MRAADAPRALRGSYRMARANPGKETQNVGSVAAKLFTVSLALIVLMASVGGAERVVQGTVSFTVAAP